MNLRPTDRVLNAPSTAAVAQPPLKGERTIPERFARQLQRIQAGVAAGTIKPGQQVADLGREGAVESQYATDMANTTGHLSKGQRTELEHQLNALSQTIHAERHTPVTRV